MSYGIIKQHQASSIIIKHHHQASSCFVVTWDIIHTCTYAMRWHVSRDGHNRRFLRYPRQRQDEAATIATHFDSSCASTGVVPHPHEHPSLFCRDLTMGPSAVAPKHDAAESPQWAQSSALAPRPLFSRDVSCRMNLETTILDIILIWTRKRKRNFRTNITRGAVIQYQSIYQSIYHSITIYRSIDRSIDLSIYHSITRSIYLSLYLSLYIDR